MAVHDLAFQAVQEIQWHIENRLHSTPDVAFYDDLVRLRTGHGPENMAVIRRCAMDLVRAAGDKIAKLLTQPAPLK